MVAAVGDRAPNDRSHWGSHSHVKILFIIQHIILSFLVKK